MYPTTALVAFFVTPSNIYWSHLIVANWSSTIFHVNTQLRSWRHPSTANHDDDDFGRYQQFLFSLRCWVVPSARNFDQLCSFQLVRRVELLGCWRARAKTNQNPPNEHRTEIGNNKSVNFDCQFRTASGSRLHRWEKDVSCISIILLLFFWSEQQKDCSVTIVRKRRVVWDLGFFSSLP